MEERSGPTLFELAGMGVVSALLVGGGVALGYFVGSATKAGSVAVFVGLALGLGAAIAATYVRIKRYL